MNENKIEIEMICRDLGMAAYLKMKGYKLYNKKRKEFVFKIKENEIEEFKQDQIEYINSPYATFDSEIMNLKKL